jgi:galactokinase
MNAGDVADGFRARFGRSPEGVWRAPGRVNLIGEHTDYNDGFVLPFAIDRETFVAAARRDDARIALASEGFGEAAEVDADALSPDAERGWWSYVHGVIAGVGVTIGGARGLDAFVASTVPTGAGLSSSAALECATAVAVDELWATGLDRVELARIARDAEQTFAGVPCGIMDQIAALFGRQGHALFLDTRSLAREAVPLLSPAHAIVVIDTRVKHALADGAYAERRHESEDAAGALGVAALRDATLEQLAASSLDDTLRARARHVISEDARVLAAVEALRADDADRVGELMLDSHTSLRADFEVSSDELNVAVGAAVDAGALGARMTGGGFGGAAIALVQSDDVGLLEAAVVERFRVEGLVEPALLRVETADAASRVS